MKGDFIMKSKNFFVLSLLVSFFAVIITSAPVFATTTPQQSPAFAATEQLPAWLAEAGATPVSDVALENVQGEVVWVAIMAGVSLVAIACLYYKWVTDPQWVINTPAAGDLLIQLQTPYSRK
ncbi:MAG: hypothetical protein ABIC82_01855 [bacterium]